MPLPSCPNSSVALWRFLAMPSSDGQSVTGQRDSLHVTQSITAPSGREAHVLQGVG